MFWPAGIRRNKGKIDICRNGTRQFNLGFFGRFTQTLKSHFVIFQINARFIFKLSNDMVNQSIVHVRSAKLIIAAGRQNFKRRRFVIRVPAHFQNRNVQGSSA